MDNRVLKSTHPKDYLEWTFSLFPRLNYTPFTIKTKAPTFNFSLRRTSEKDSKTKEERMDGCLGLTVAVVAVLLHCTAAATNNVVGDNTGWTIPTGGAQFYTNWAAGKTFAIGDTLTFNFNAQQHDVAEVTKQEYDACTSSSPIGTIIRTSPANITLNSTGNHYYICTFTGHCAAGQKLAVNAIQSNSTAPSSPPTTSPASPTAPTVSKAPSPSPTVRSGPSPSPMVSKAPSPSPAVLSSPSPSPTMSRSPLPSPSVSSGPSHSPSAPNSPAPSTKVSSAPSPSQEVSSNPSPQPTAPNGSPSPPTPLSGPSSSTEPNGANPPGAVEGPPPPSGSSISLTASFQSMSLSIVILSTFFL